MTVVNPKSISGITSITTASGSDNLLTIHTSDANNTERFRIDSTGSAKVGSGVTLSPDGDVFTTGISTFGGNIQIGSDSPEFEMNAGGPRFRVPSANTLTIFTSGGMGATTSERLRIASDGVITGRAELRLTEGTSSTSNGDEIGSLMYLHPASDNKNAKIVALHNGGSSGADLAFFTRTQADATNNDGGEERLRIASNGRIGINTSNPTSRLTVAAPNGTTQIEIKRLNSNATGTVGALNFTAFDGHSVANISAVADGDNEGAHLVFRTTSAAGELSPFGGSTIDRLRITSDGKVGIDVTDPDAKLEVRDSGATGIIIRCTNTQSTDTNKAIRVRNNSDTDTFAVSHTGKVFPLDNIVMASGKGIDFGATSDGGGSMGSELLDDYEEGTWTPSWGGSSVLGTTSYVNNQASYKKIGKLVFVSGVTEVTGNTGGSGAWTCTNLPIVGDTGNDYVAPGSCFLYNFNLPDTALWVVPYKNSQTNDFSLYYTRDNSAWAQLQLSQDTAWRIIFSLTYHAN